MSEKKGKVTMSGDGSLTEEPKLTLRQRLRADSVKQLEKLVAKGREALEAVVADTGIDARALSKLVGNDRTETLRENCITVLTNNRESELETLYNQQQDLPGVDDEAKQ